MELTQKRWQNYKKVLFTVVTFSLALQVVTAAKKVSGHDSANPPMSQEAVARRNDGVFFGLGGLDTSLFDFDKFFEQAAPTRTAALTTRAASTSRPSGTRSSASRGATASPTVRASATTRSRAAVVADDGAFFDEELGTDGGNFPSQQQHRQREISPSSSGRDDTDFRSPTPSTTRRQQPSSSAAPRDGSGRAFSRSPVEELRDDPRHQRQSFRGQSPNGHASFENEDRERFDGPPPRQSQPVRPSQPDRFRDFNQPPPRQTDRPDDIRSQSQSSQFLGGGGVFRPAQTQPPLQQHVPFRPALPSLPNSPTQDFTPPSVETRRPTTSDSSRDNDNFDQRHRQFDAQRPNAEDDRSFQQPPRGGEEQEQRRPFTGQSPPTSNQRSPSQNFREPNRPFFPSNQDQRPGAFVITENDQPEANGRRPSFGSEPSQHDRPSPSHFDFGTGVNDDNRHRLQDNFFDGPSQGPPPQGVDDFVEEERPTSSTNQRHRDQDAAPPSSGKRHQSSERPTSDERAPLVSSERPTSDERPFFFDSGSQEDPQQFHDPTTSFQHSQEAPLSEEIRDGDRHTTEEASPPPVQPQQQHRRPPQDPPIQTFRPPTRFQPPQPSIAASSAFRNSDPSQQAAVHETIHRFPSTVPTEDLQRDQLHDRFIDSLSVHQKQRQQVIQPHPDNFRSHQLPVVSSTVAPPVFRGTPPSSSRPQHVHRPDDSFRQQQTFSRPIPAQREQDDSDFQEEQRPGASSRGVTPHFFQQANAAESTGQLAPSFVRATEPTNFEVLDRRPVSRFSPASNVHHQSRSSSSDFLPTSATVRSQTPLTPTTTDKVPLRTKHPSTALEQSGRRRQPNSGRSIQSPSFQPDELDGGSDQHFQLPHHLNAGLVSKFHHGTPRSQQDHLSEDTTGDDFTFRRPSSAFSSQQIDPNAHRTSSTSKRLPATDAGRRGGTPKRGRPSSTARTTATQFATENTIEDEDDGLDPVPTRVRGGGGHSSFSGGGGTVAVAGQVATTCHPETCRLPKCFCGGNQIQPGNLEPEEIPQMIVLTFDDAVNDLNAALYNRLFYKERLNPNGCNMLSTFYVSHEWTDYAKVQNLYAKGHEIASHSISHLDGRDFSKKKWYNEVYGQKEIMSVYAGVQLDDIRGMRSPFLAMGGDKQFAMLYETNFTYDTSMTVTDVHPPFWPYTLDHAIPHRCAIPPCPKLSYPGFWEIPMVALTDLNGGKCSMADSCSFSTTEDGIYEMLMKNFERHYKSNRSPFGLYYHASWFLIPHRQEGFVKFLEEVMKKDDVYLVTALQMLEWVKNPTPLSRIKDFEPWQCHNKKPPAPPCSRPSSCELRFKGDVRYMSTCHACPDKYPWVGDTGVAKHAHTISA